jgi:ribosomal-protein-alanine N-acetyltransferase
VVTILYFQPFVTRFGAGMSHFMTYEEFHSTPFILESERLQIRRLTMADDEAIHSYGKDERVAFGASFPQHKSIEDARTYIRTVLESYQKNEPTSYGIVLKDSGELIGGVGFHHPDTSAHKIEIGYALAPWQWHKGYMREAAFTMVDHIFRVTELQRLEARCKSVNTASARVMERLGMIYEGTLRHNQLYNGNFYDIKVYSTLRDEWLNRS